MMTAGEAPKQDQKDFSREHLANERTFLSWIRTSIGIMAFGFVLERFAFFIKRLVLLERIGLSAAGQPAGVSKALSTLHTQGYSAILGMVFVLFGIVLAAFAFARYREVRKEISEQRYYPKATLNVALTAFVLITGLLLLVYLIKSV
ncbi:MAG: DUF202 domain-containing protein [Nitrospiraceae bacterium]|nr:DUF202 domain-containing protein [Nitrospiraceae bacterium]